MKYFKRLKLYKASNVTFNPEKIQAYSYGWWKFVDVINGKVVFNDYYYSSSTGRHQSKVKHLMSKLGIGIGHYIECPAGLQSDRSLSSSIELYQTRINKLKDMIANPRSRAITNAKRMEQVNYFQSKIDEVKALLPQTISDKVDAA